MVAHSHQTNSQINSLDHKKIVEREKKIKGRGQVGIVKLPAMLKFEYTISICH
jgi:hypothetical protein